MVEDDSSGKRLERMASQVFNSAAVLFLLVGSGSAMAQAIVLPRVETSFGPLFGLWVVTAIFYLAGTAMILLKREPLVLGAFFVTSALTAVALVGIIATYVLTARDGVSGLEYSALSAYAFFLAVIVMMVLAEIAEKRQKL